MAVDKLVDSTQLNADLTSVANAIRTKGGTSAQMAFPNGFVSAVDAIPTGITPTGTKQISITQNGTVTEDVTNYASAEISVNVSGGGGASPIQLLGTVTVPSDTRAVSIDTAPYNSYDFYFCIIDATLTASDWLYVVIDGSSPSGGTYQLSSINHHGLIFMVAKQYSNAMVCTYLFRDINANVTNNPPNNMYIYTYVATKLIKAGSTFKIYGGNYADM